MVKHTATLGKSSRADSRVRFSPEVVQKFANLSALVENSPTFDDAVRSMLHDRAEGKPAVGIADALMSVAAIAAEVGSEAEATGNRKAYIALQDVIAQIGDLEQGHNGVTLEMARPRLPSRK